MISWIVGSGGLLGGAVARRCDSRFAGSPVPWSDPASAVRTLAQDAERFRADAGQEPWAIVWAAGAATVATSAEQADAELTVLTTLLAAIRDRPPQGPGRFFLASSAGGVYAGSSHPPFDSRTPPVPIGPYGRLKLAQEEAAGRSLADTCPVVIGRLANLYGPGQNLEKLQGLISRLCLAAATGRPINIFVSLDTIRDYVFVDDAASAILKALEPGNGSMDQAGYRTTVIASGQPTTVGQLIRTTSLVTKRRVPVAYGSHPSARDQVLDLRLLPTAPEAAQTPLPAGVKTVFVDILARLQTRLLTA